MPDLSMHLVKSPLKAGRTNLESGSVGRVARFLFSIERRPINPEQRRRRPRDVIAVNRSVMMIETNGSWLTRPHPLCLVLSWGGGGLTDRLSAAGDMYGLPPPRRQRAAAAAAVHAAG